MAQTLDLGLLAGAYHYVGGQGVETEADNFAQAIKPYLRHVLVCIDWEDNDNAAWRDESYLDAQGEAGGQEVQDAINHVYDATAEQLADEAWAGRWGNGPMLKAALGHRYRKVMAAANGSRTYTVVKGDTLSGIGRKLGTRWQDIAERNGIAAPYTIYTARRLVALPACCSLG